MCLYFVIVNAAVGTNQSHFCVQNIHTGRYIYIELYIIYVKYTWTTFEDKMSESDEVKKRIACETI